MNKFKKLVAVLVSVVMACVFATGVYGMDGVVNSLNETQLRALRDNSVALRNALTQAKNALNGAKTEADVRTAVSAALSQVGGIFSDAGISLNIDVVASGSEVAVVLPLTVSLAPPSGSLPPMALLLLLPTRSPLLLLQSSRLPVTTALWSLLPSFCLLLVSSAWLSARRVRWLCKPMQHPMSLS